MAKEFKVGDKVEFRPYEEAPAKDIITGEIVGTTDDPTCYLFLPDWAKRKGWNKPYEIHYSHFYSVQYGGS